MFVRRRFLLTCVAGVIAASATAARGEFDEPKPDPTNAVADGKVPTNIIVLIADGAGYSTLEATRYWLGRPLTADGDGFQPVAVATYSIRRRQRLEEGADPLAQEPNLVYDPTKAWDTTPVAGASKFHEQFPAICAGYEWHRSTFPDSANTMSALMTGVRSYNGAINVDGAGTPQRSLAEAMHERGGRSGMVTSVMLNDATPAAGGGAHEFNRRNGQAITRDLFGSDVLSVIGGGGHPGYDASGRSVNSPDYDGPDDPYGVIPVDLWRDLREGSNRTGYNDGWTLVTGKADIEALARFAPPPERLAMVPQTDSYLQKNRPYPDGIGRDDYAPGDSPLVPNVPSLADMTLAALRVLDRAEGGSSGFFLASEGGACDKAMHALEFGRMIEEYAFFDETVQAVVDYLESGEHGATFDNTLLIVTADHDHLLFGPDRDEPFDPIEDKGPGKLPGYRWHFLSHSNRLVPLFARGPGSDGLIALADKVDEHTDEQGRTFGQGAYTTQADIGRYLLELVDAKRATPVSTSPAR